MGFDMQFQSRRSDVLATRGMVATSQPLAAQAGLDILKQGGNAADAAVATAAMLNVVEPMMTGIGGDCFALYWDARTQTVTALNGSGRAPAAASPDELRQQGYSRMPSSSGHTVSVPGSVAGWSDLLARHGTLSLADVLQPAIWTAQNGYPVTEVVAGFWARGVAKLLRSPDWQSDDLDNGPEQPSGHELLLDGQAPKPGQVMRLPTLAATLRAIAEQGKDFIYRGAFARKLSEHVQRYGGWMTPADMAAHTSTWDDPITAQYRDVTLYECPPNGQGLAAIVAAKLAAGFDLAALEEADRVHILVECMRLGFADALQWVADPEVEALPLAELLGDDYTARRRAQIDRNRAATQVDYGELRAGSETVYLTVVDGDGNACSFINSIAASFGSGLVVPSTGVCLQNRGANFSLSAGHPNLLAPHKRPYHTIIPAMTVYSQGEYSGALHASFGVMGGLMQPQGHLQMLSNLQDLHLSPQRALDRPRWRLVVSQPGRGLQPTGADQAGGLLYVEKGWGHATLAELARRGHRLLPVDGFDRTTFGGGQIILRDPATGVLTGGSEPRKDGAAVGW